MKTLNKILALGALAAMFSSCGNNVNSAKDAAAKLDTAQHNYEAIQLGLSDSGSTMTLPSALMEVNEGESALQPIFIRNVNNGFDGQSITLSANFDNLTSAGLTVTTSCPANNILMKRQGCYYYISKTVTADSLTQDETVGPLTYNINGTDYSFTLKMKNFKTTSELVSEELNLSGETLSFSAVEGFSSKTKYSVFKNNSRQASIVLSATGFNDELQAMAAAEHFVLSTSCGNSLVKRHSCVVSFKPRTDLAPGSYSDTVTFQGKVINLSLTVVDNPADNNNYAEVYGQDDIPAVVTRSGHHRIFVRNLSPEYQTAANSSVLDMSAYQGSSLNYSQLLSLVFGDAITVTDNCGVDHVLNPSEICSYDFKFDPQRLPSGVQVSHDIVMNGQNITLTIEGGCGCPAGEKYNEDKTACVPNVGTFDSGNSLFGYAVFAE